MANDIRLDLLMKEIKDEYVQENFRKLKRYLDCIERKIDGGGSSGGGNTIVINPAPSFHKDDFEVDAPFIISRTKTLSENPTTDSEGIYLNGLLLPDSCYTIVGDLLTIDGALDLEVGDDIFVRYAS